MDIVKYKELTKMDLIGKQMPNNKSDLFYQKNLIIWKTVLMVTSFLGITQY